MSECNFNESNVNSRESRYDFFRDDSYFLYFQNYRRDGLITKYLGGGKPLSAPLIYSTTEFCINNSYINRYDKAAKIYMCVIKSIFSSFHLTARILN